MLAFSTERTIESVLRITTAAGLTVAIPTYMFHRFFLRKVDSLVLNLEQESIKLVDALHSDRLVEVKQ